MQSSTVFDHESGVGYRIAGVDAGGTRDDDGVGVTRDRVNRYWTAIKEITESSGKTYPNEINAEDARKYVQVLQRSTRAVSSQRQRLGLLKGLFKIAIRYGYADSNAFASMAIRIPKGAEPDTYRPFTNEELVMIFRYIKEQEPNNKSLGPLVLLATGARIGEISKLRHEDLKTTDSGISYLDMVHDPDGQFPHPLKTDKANERHVPLHPVVIDSGFLELFESGEAGYIFSGSLESGCWSKWFQTLLKNVGIYEPRIATLHSIRNTIIDAWRMAGITTEFRRAFTGHTSRDTQESTYGVGLRFFPIFCTSRWQELTGAG